MDVINDIREEVQGTMRSTLNDRLGNPLYRGFVVAWMAINWRAIGVMIYPMSEWDFPKRLAHIGTAYYPTGCDVFLNTLLYPTLIALFYRLVMPEIVSWVEVGHQWIKARAEARTESAEQRYQAKYLNAMEQLKGAYAHATEELNDLKKRSTENSLELGRTKALLEMKDTGNVAEIEMGQLALLMSHIKYENAPVAKYLRNVKFGQIASNDFYILKQLGLAKRDDDGSGKIILTPLGARVLQVVSNQ